MAQLNKNKTVDLEVDGSDPDAARHPVFDTSHSARALFPGCYDVDILKCYFG